MSSLQQDTFYNIAQDSQCHTHKDKNLSTGKWIQMTSTGIMVSQFLKHGSL